MLVGGRQNSSIILRTDDPSDLDGERVRRTTCSVVVALMQQPSTPNATSEAVRMLQIGFIIYKAQSHANCRLTLDHLMHNPEVAKSGTYVNFREVCGRFDLRPGHYIVIPSTYEPDCDGQFLLRLFAKKHISFK